MRSWPVSAKETTGETAPSSPEPQRLAEGTMLGRFKIRELLGEGGMGAVYRATDVELARQVAIKVLSGHGAVIAGGDVEQRLMREAQALAKVNHPNVIAIYDVAHTDGMAFVAMELVEGVRLDVWLEQTTRRRAEILAVFTQAGRGLAAAHAQGLVHRDFKPPNVIIGNDGRVRVLDFGLARAAGGVDTEPPVAVPAPAASSLLDSPLTLAGLVIGTTKYMAPEQLRGGEVDARSDQFSFCVALYRALYGDMPFDPDSLDARRTDDAAWQVRAAPPNNDVPPWLRAVLVRGLSAQPRARFPSMEALLAAIADDPAPRRRRVAAAAVAMTALAASSAFVVRRARAPEESSPCARVASRLDEVWNDDQRAAVARAFVASGRPFAAAMQATITTALDDYGQAWSAMRLDACRATHVTRQQSGELLDLRMQCLDRRLEHLRAATGVLASADATTVEKALQVVQSLPSLDECADATALRAPAPLPADPAQRAQIEVVRAELTRAETLFAAGKLEEATGVVERAHAAAAPLDYPPLAAEAALALGNAHYENGEYADAEKILNEGVAIALAARRDDLAVRFWRDLIWTVGYQERRYAEAHATAALAEAMLGRVGTDPREQAKLYGAIAALHQSEENREEALRYDQRALELITRAYGEASGQVATGMTNVGSDYLYQRDFAKARELFARVLEIRERLVGPEHPATGRALLNLSSATAELGNLDEATALQRRALAILEPSLGPDHPVIATALGNLGKNLAMSGKLDDALAAYDRAMAIVTRVHGPESAQVAVLHARRGALRRRQGRHADGLAEYQAALAIDERKDPESAATGRDRLDIGDTLVELGRHAEARREFERAEAILAKALGPRDPEVAGPLVGLGTVELAMRRPAAAVAPLERALGLLDETDTSGDLERARFALARALWDSGRDRARAQQLAKLANKSLP